MKTRVAVLLGILVLELTLLYSPAAWSEPDPRTFTATHPDSGDTVQITDKPCESEVILKSVDADVLKAVRYGRARIAGASYDVCWYGTSDLILHVLYEDGDTGEIPFSDFKPDAPI